MLILHPVEIVGFPAAEDEGHVLDVLGHRCSATSGADLHTLVVLRQREHVAHELIVKIKEIHLHVEWLLRVNLVRGPFPVGVKGTYMRGIDRTVALMAPAVDPVHRGLASMGFRLEGIPVGLHDVKLRAQVASWII